MNAKDLPLESLLRRLHLANAPRVYKDLCARAEKEQWSYRDFLAVLVAEEVAHRKQTRIQRLVRRARFPFLKTIDDFDFTYQSTLRLQMLGSCLSPDFVTDGRSLILSGKSGRGKTHLAVAIAYRAIQTGFEALFTTCAALVDDLSRAGRDGCMLEAIAPYIHAHVLVIDEVGYLTYGPDAANVLFHVVNERHLRRRSMVFTTNKPLGAWGRVLHDLDLAAAILDRVLERGHLLELDGPSLRTKHLGLDDPTAAGVSPEPAPAIFSGNHRPEFPEPTRPHPRSASRALSTASALLHPWSSRRIA
jgi:DNA replication protein DnaC